MPVSRAILHEYIWVDLFAGAGNLVLSILDYIPQNERIEFFGNDIFNNLVATQNGDKMIEFIKNKNGQGEWKLRY